MKVYIRKISIIFLMLSLIFVTMNIGSYVSYAEDSGKDFSYYYVGAESDIKTCSASEINDVIAGATGDIVIEMNNDVKLENTLLFENTRNYTLNLNDYKLTVVNGFRFIKVLTGANVTIKNGTMEGALLNKTTTPKAVDRDGAGIYCNDATVNIEGLIIANNLGRYGGGIYLKGGTLNATNSKIIDNSAEYSSGGGIWANNNSVINLEDCEISGNNLLTNANGLGAGIYSVSSTLTATNVKIINNGLKSSKVEVAGVYIASKGSVATFNNCLIAGNYASDSSAASAAGLTVFLGDVTLNDTIIRNNTGCTVGGVSINPDASKSTINFRMNGGSIYNNIATEAYESGIYPNDLFIKQWYLISDYSVNIPAADEMKSDEEDKIFAGYYWNHTAFGDTEEYEELYDPIELKTITSSIVYNVYNASDSQERVVAQLLNGSEVISEFKTITEAFEAASSGNTIKLIAGETDGTGMLINEAVSFDKDKSIIIDLNGRKWNSGNSSLKALTLKDGANVTITGEGTLKDIEYNGTGLKLDSAAIVSKIYLGTGKVVKAGSNFGLSKELSFELSSEDIEKLKTEDITLIEKTNDISDETIANISIADADSLVVIQKNSNGNVIAHTMKGIFLNGQSGDDANNGTTVDTPVKTFAKVKELLNDINVEAIFVTGTVTVDETEEWSLPEGKALMRYGEFKEYLVDVKGKLTLKDITIDGYRDKVEAKTALIKVETDGELNVNEGTKLINNNHSKINKVYYEAGGAIYSNGKINMNGGEISGNTSWYGAGIELWGENASMVLDSGAISNNNAISLSNYTTGGGGGIAAMQGATFTMNGGEISNNESRETLGIGGGILVGFVNEVNDSKGAVFTMNGGKVLGNKSTLDGGGIYVQCLSTATINAGEITENVCVGVGSVGGAQGAYGGGGIYVNGGRTGYEDGKLYISNAYISGNVARQKEGAAIAGCGTSTVYIYPESATIYNNEGDSEIYVDSTMQTGYGNIAKIDISKYAIGGGDNHWNDGETELTTEQLKTLEPETRLIINNSDAENVDTTGELSPVKITGNISATYGAGIGTNGYVQIGEDKEIKTEVKVTKTWEDNNDEHGLRPDSITVNLLANGKEVAEKEITAEDDWEHTFTELEKYDENEEKIEYTITEDAVEEYKTEIDGYDITNICTKEADSANREDEEEPKDESDPKDPDIGESSITTGDNIVMNFIALAVSGIVLSRIAKSRKHTAKHRK